MLQASRSFAILLHEQVYSQPLRLLSKVDPPNDIDIQGHQLELWNVLCPGAPSPCERYIDPQDIADVDQPDPL